MKQPIAELGDVDETTLLEDCRYFAIEHYFYLHPNRSKANSSELLESLQKVDGWTWPEGWEPFEIYIDWYSGYLLEKIEDMAKATAVFVKQQLQ